MAATSHGVVTTLERPGLRGEDHWCTVVASMVEKAACRVGQRIDSRDSRTCVGRTLCLQMKEAHLSLEFEGFE
jgi:hypothetical protein